MRMEDIECPILDGWYKFRYWLMNISRQITQVKKLLYKNFLVLKFFRCTVCLPKPSQVFAISWAYPPEWIYRA